MSDHTFVYLEKRCVLCSQTVAACAVLPCCFIVQNIDIDKPMQAQTRICIYINLINDPSGWQRARKLSTNMAPQRLSSCSGSVKCAVALRWVVTT